MAMMMERRKMTTDPVLFFATLALLAIGVITVFNSSYARTMGLNQNGFFYLKRQAMYGALGLTVMLFFMRFGYWHLRRPAALLLLGAFVMLFLVWMPGLGIRENGAARWIGLFGIRVQPSEVVKLALIVYLAALLSRRNYPIRDLWEGLLPALLVVCAVFLVVEREPDLGTAFVIGLGSLSMLCLAGARSKHIMCLVAIASVIGVLLLPMIAYRGDRIRWFMHPDADPTGHTYQILHGLYAIGSGGIGGLGFGMGREKYYLPAANTDFVFATIAEETGTLGCMVVLGLLFLIGWRALDIARNAADPFAQLLAAGIGATVTWQALLNMLVVTGSVPATGVPLPFVSYGGSSLVFLLVGIGILLNIAHYSDRTARV